MGFYILTYVCGVVFAAALLARVVRQFALPMHVRWEIYPIPHEGKDRSVYGGSYMEKTDWWRSPVQTSPLSEAKYMAPEILLLRGLWKANRPLWWVSFPFHLGLYLMLGVFVLLMISAVWTLGLPPGGGGDGLIRNVVAGAVAVCGWIGLIAGGIGSLGLLLKRLSDRDLRLYATPLDYFNIIFIMAFFVCAALTAVFTDPLFHGARLYFMGLLTAGGADPSYRPGQSFFGAATIVLGSLLAAYIPLSHLSHMFMKYYLYHRVKWDDRPSRPGNDVEAAVVRNLAYRPTWCAKHIGADGRKTWREIASGTLKETK